VRHIPESTEHFPTESPSVLRIASDLAFKPKMQVGGERNWAASKMRAAGDKGTVARNRERLDAQWTKIDSIVPAGRNNLSNDTRSSGDDDTDNLTRNEGTTLDDDDGYDRSLLDGGNDAGNNMTLTGGDN
jgi:hypothetical protein